MRIIIGESTIPSFNLATEEYLLKNTYEDIFMLWQNGPSVIVGRNQNTYSEVNFEYLTENKIPVIRRLSGGGAVFHDLGNLNYTFILRNGKENFNNYSLFADLIIKTLNKFSINAALSGRNDLLIEDRKFSGNAQCCFGNDIMHHGTLLFNSDIDMMTRVLTTDPLKFKTKGIASNRSRVTNISEHLASRISINDFADLIIKTLLEKQKDANILPLNEYEIKEIERLQKEKYSTSEWNFGFKQEFTFKNKTKLPSGILDINLEIRENIIINARIFGDYFTDFDISILENLLTGQVYDPENLKKYLKEINISSIFKELDNESFVKLLF